MNAPGMLADLMERKMSETDWTPLRLCDSKDPRAAQVELDAMRKDPKLFITGKLGLQQTWAGQDEIMRRIATHQRVSVGSGHALGKDHITARIMLWFAYCFSPSIVIATASSDRQVDKIIWGELSEAFHGSLVKLPGRLLSKELVIDEKRKWYALGFTTKDIHQMPGKFQGFHSENILVVFSEAQAIDRAVWEQAESLMTSGNARHLVIGNPLLNFGPFYESLQPGSGFSAINLDCEKSPNVIARREIIPGLCSHLFVENMEKKYGRNSSTFRSKVNGLSPTRTTESFIDARWIEKAARTGIGNAKANGIKIIGVDLSGGGTDKTVIVTRDGMRVIEMRKYLSDQILVWREGSGVTTEPRSEDVSRPLQAADMVEELIRAGCHRCYLDVGGLGEVVYDYLVRRGLVNKVVPVNFGGRAREDENDPGQKNLAVRERYKDMGTQMYARFAKLLELGQASIPDDPDLHMQLVNRKMFDLPTGQKKLESKNDFSARGFDSPDEADATVLCYCDVEPDALIEAAVTIEQEDETLGALWDR